MFRFLVISALIGIALSSPVDIKKAKSRKIYSLSGIVGEQPHQQLSNDSPHVKFAPQDPLVTADSQPDVGRSDINNNNNENYPESHQILQKQTIKTTTTTTTRRPQSIDYDALNRHQNQHAHYQFDSSVQDDINDGSHTRSEVRDGLKVTGMYSYSDGFYHRTVHYIADENGYRVVKESAEKIGDGPQFNADGVADVQTSLTGGYSIKIDDRERNPHYVGFNNIAN